jgi:hypothetical protein
LDQCLTSSSSVGWGSVRHPARQLAVAAFVVPAETARYDALVDEILETTKEDVVLGNLESFPCNLDANELGEGLVNR